MKDTVCYINLKKTFLIDDIELLNIYKVSGYMYASSYIFYVSNGFFQDT